MEKRQRVALLVFPNKTEPLFTAKEREEKGGREGAQNVPHKKGHTGEQPKTN